MPASEGPWKRGLQSYSTTPLVNKNGFPFKKAIFPRKNPLVKEIDFPYKKASFPRKIALKKRKSDFLIKGM